MAKGDFSSVVEILVFLIACIGGIISEIAKKNKAKKQAEEIEREEARQQSPAPAAPTPVAAPKRAAAAKPAKKTTAKKTDDPEWLATLADRKRRETAKAAAKAAAVELESELNNTQNNEPRDPPPFTLSPEQVRNGFILSEILGPPVSMR